MMKVKVIHVKVDSTADQVHVDQFEALLGNLLADGKIPSPQRIDTFVTPVGQSSSVYLTAIVRYYDPIATPAVAPSAL